MKKHHTISTTKYANLSAIDNDDLNDRLNPSDSSPPPKKSDSINMQMILAKLSKFEELEKEVRDLKIMLNQNLDKV